MRSGGDVPTQGQKVAVRAGWEERLGGEAGSAPFPRDAAGPGLGVAVL